jgi:hypothetical protein
MISPKVLTLIMDLAKGLALIKSLTKGLHPD